MFHVKHSPLPYRRHIIFCDKMEKEKIESVKGKVRNIPDFPVKGIQFKDLTTAFKDPESLRVMADALIDMYKDKGITKVVGIEARGFIFGAILAAGLGAGFVPLRKPGKLPAKTIKKTYTKEYGEDTIEIHEDSIGENDVVLMHDDLLATGGTMAAAIDLVNTMNPKKIYVNFIWHNGCRHRPGEHNEPQEDLCELHL